MSRTVPAGVPGRWNLAFRDEFSGTALDTSKWVAAWARMNDVTCYPENVTVTGGNLILTLASPVSGAMVTSGDPAYGHGPRNWTLPVGGVVEARVRFPGDGTEIYNWPAWWVSGPDWPAAGENDIAEGLGTLTVNYHSPSGGHNHGPVPGVWSNAFHRYALHRARSSCDVYYDGRRVKSYPTDDNGRPQALILNVGIGKTHVYGARSQVRVDYVRGWAPA